MDKIKIQCPAKINLTLKILRKRPDGFHDIESIMQTINLFDYLTISRTPSDKTEIILKGTSKDITYDENNLVYKAAKLFFQTCEQFRQSRIEIFIEKNIPVAAGLAGGSTDAAGTIFGLNEIFDKPLGRDELHTLCSQLGSDLNFCLEGGKQKTTGRGEVLEKLPFENFDVSLIKPENLGISAGYAYKRFSQKIKDEKIKNFVNDLEWAVTDDFPELLRIKNNYPDAVMSGSGSTYYLINGIFENKNGFWVRNNLQAIPSGVEIVE